MLGRIGTPGKVACGEGPLGQALEHRSGERILVSDLLFAGARRRNS